MLELIQFTPPPLDPNPIDEFWDYLRNWLDENGITMAQVTGWSFDGNKVTVTAKKAS